MDQLASPTRHLLYYDQRGGGRSLLPPGLPAAGIREHLDDLRAVIASETVGDRRPALVGYSWGALLALHLALEAPELIERLLLVSPAPPYAAARALIKERLRLASERPEAQAFIATLDRSDRRARFASAVVGYFHDPRRALELTPFVARERAERAVWDSLGDYDLRPRLASLRVPTLICHGISDPIPIEGARLIAAASGARLVELPDCGHAPYIEGQARFLAVARPFLSDA
jgi:proline iminopeptidase